MVKVEECPCCDSKEIENVFKFVEGFDFNICGCGACYAVERMTDEEQFEFYRSGAYRDKLAKLGDYGEEVKLQERRAEVIGAMADPFEIGSHLDIGCSMGELLKRVARGKDIKSVGVDPDPKWTKDVTNLYRSIDEVEGKFDLITMIEVLEHLNKPQEMLRKIKERMSPGGVLIVEVPNRRAYLVAFNYPQHVVAYDVGALGRLLVKCGFEVIAFDVHDYLHEGPLDLYIYMVATNDKELCKGRVK